MDDKKKILFVDDDESICNLLKRATERGGKFVVQTALTGNEALASVRSFMPDLIVLDLMLPDIAGSAVAAALKDDPRTAGIPIIFLTGLAEGQDSGSQPRQTGDNWVMAKPVSPFNVVAAIEKILLETGERR